MVELGLRVGAGNVEVGRETLVSLKLAVVAGRAGRRHKIAPERMLRAEVGQGVFPVALHLLLRIAETAFHIFRKSLALLDRRQL